MRDKMSEQFSNLFLSGLILFSKFIHSHPLYLCYIIFFSPYLIKLFSYLSPLFVTTSLLLLGLLTVHPQAKDDFVLSPFKALREKLCSKTDPQEDDFCKFEELELYKIVFDTSSAFCQVGVADPPCEITGMGFTEVLDHSLDEKTVEVDWEESAKTVIEEDQDLEEFQETLEDFESIPCYVDEKKIELPFEVKKEVLPTLAESDEMASKTRDDIVKFCTFLDSPSSRAFDSSLGSYGSMRKEKEWTRTLACKLFEERSRGNGEEGMDLLWETYENDLSKKMKSKAKRDNNNKNKKTDTEFCYEGGDDEDEVVSGQVCCLQALKFSTGKMNLGMGRPNIVKISKTIKGFGWLRNMTRHSKRGETSK